MSRSGVYKAMPKERKCSALLQQEAPLRSIWMIRNHPRSRHQCKVVTITPQDHLQHTPRDFCVSSFRDNRADDHLVIFVIRSPMAFEQSGRLSRATHSIFIKSAQASSPSCSHKSSSAATREPSGMKGVLALLNFVMPVTFLYIVRQSSQ